MTDLNLKFEEFMADSTIYLDAVCSKTCICGSLHFDLDTNVYDNVFNELNNFLEKSIYDKSIKHL